MAKYLYLDGNSLSPEDLVALSKAEKKIQLSDEAKAKVNRARDMLEEIVEQGKIVYGITTGFGVFADTFIGKDGLIALQENLVRSHAAGVGEPLTHERTRAMLALRINVLAKGHSGISLKVLQQYIDACNASCLPIVPQKGSVGASGDLAPLSHLAMGMMGEGKMWSPETGIGEAKSVLEAHGLDIVRLGPKEGIALINGTQMMTSLGAEAVVRATAIARQADVIMAFTLEMLKGVTKAFTRDVHEVRAHKGQGSVARRLRSLLHSDVHPSQITEARVKAEEAKEQPPKVQDAYSLRCTPQVHGVVNDTIDFVRSVLTVEMNSATDNPLVFPDLGEIISAGNFHGEYPAKMLDYLAIGVHELANISERRTERLLNPAYNYGMPCFLTNEGGLNNGFMIAHYTAAALVSENKVLTHPSSVDSITTCAGTEDHVSMGGFSARKSLIVVEHVEQVLAVELLAACQALEFRRPLKTTAPLEAVYKLVRTVAKPWDRDRFMAPDMDAVTELLQQEKVWQAAEPFMKNYEDTHKE